MGECRKETWASGAFGKASFEGRDIDLTEWNIDVGGSDADLTHSGGNELEEDMAITKEYTGEISGNWRFSNQPTDRPPALYRGECGTLQLYISQEAYVEVEVEIKTFGIVSAVNDVVKWVAGFKATAHPTWPGATARSSSSSSHSSSSSSSSSSST